MNQNLDIFFIPVQFKWNVFSLFNMNLYIDAILLTARIPQAFPFLCKLGRCSLNVTRITKFLWKINQNKLWSIRARLHGGGGPQIGEVTCGGSPHLSCKRYQIKTRDYMDRRATPPKRVTTPTWGTPPPCKQALSRSRQRLCRNFKADEDGIIITELRTVAMSRWLISFRMFQNTRSLNNYYKLHLDAHINQ